MKRTTSGKNFEEDNISIVDEMVGLSAVCMDLVLYPGNVTKFQQGTHTSIKN